jgi:poly(A) polymerase
MQLAATYDDLEQRIELLRQQEELDAIRPDLSGADIMRILGISEGPAVGRAYRYLLDVRLDRGPLPPDEAAQLLTAWWREQSG